MQEKLAYDYFGVDLDLIRDLVAAELPAARSGSSFCWRRPAPLPLASHRKGAELNGGLCNQGGPALSDERGVRRQRVPGRDRRRLPRSAPGS